MDDIEKAMYKELDEISKLLNERRQQLFSEPLSHANMGRAMALGNLDNEIWHMMRRLNPSDEKIDA